MTSKCVWTGQPFPPLKRGGQDKKFADAAARNQAHTAARLYTEELIANGFMTWEQLRAWFDQRQKAASPPCTLPIPHEQGEKVA